MNQTCQLDLTLSKCQDICKNKILICECNDANIRIECEPTDIVFYKTPEFQFGLLAGVVAFCCLFQLFTFYYYKKKYQINIRDHHLSRLHISKPNHQNHNTPTPMSSPRNQSYNHLYINDLERTSSARYDNQDHDIIQPVLSSSHRSRPGSFIQYTPRAYDYAPSLEDSQRGQYPSYNYPTDHTPEDQQYQVLSTSKQPTHYGNIPGT